jgi:hypothetical protein
MLLLGLMLLVIAKVREFRYIVYQTKFSDASFRSSLASGEIFLIVGKLALGIILVAGVILALTTIGTTTGILPTGIYAGLFLLGVITFLFFKALAFLFFYVPLLKAVCASLLTDNLPVFENVAAASRDSPRYGEGLADALDVGAF